MLGKHAFQVFCFVCPLVPHANSFTLPFILQCQHHKNLFPPFRCLRLIQTRENERLTRGVRFAKSETLKKRRNCAYLDDRNNRFSTGCSAYNICLHRSSLVQSLRLLPLLLFHLSISLLITLQKHRKSHLVLSRGTLLCYFLFSHCD